MLGFKIPGLPEGMGMGDLAKLVSNPAQLVPMAAGVMPGHTRAMALMALSQELAAHASGLSLVSRIASASAMAERRDVNNDELQRLAACTDALFKVATRLWEVPDGKLSGDDLARAFGFAMPAAPIEGQAAE